MTQFISQSNRGWSAFNGNRQRPSGDVFTLRALACRMRVSSRRAIATFWRVARSTTSVAPSLMARRRRESSSRTSRRTLTSTRRATSCSDTAPASSTTSSRRRSWRRKRTAPVLLSLILDLYALKPEKATAVLDARACIVRNLFFSRKNKNKNSRWTGRKKFGNVRKKKS